MDYIETRPPVSRADIEDLLTKVESVKTQAIDGAVLSNLVRACFDCALKKGKLIELSVGDVAKGGSVGDVMRVDGSEVSLSDQANQVKQRFQNHIDYLKKSGYRLYPTSPLFPTRKKTGYTERQLQNHLAKCSTADITLEQVRQAGICSYYENLKQEGLSPIECLKRTEDFARVEDRRKIKNQRHIKNLLVGKIQPTGRKTSSVSEYLGKIEEAAIESNKAESQKGDQIYEEIRREIQNDPYLNEEEKRALKVELDSRRQETKALLSSQNSSPKESQFKSIADIAKNAKI